LIVTYIHSKGRTDWHRVQTRCRNLANAIRRTGINQANLLDLESFVCNHQAARTLCASSDLLIVHRYMFGPVLHAVQFWMARDKKVLVDIDEAVHLLPPASLAYDFWHKGMPFDGCGVDPGAGVISPSPIEQLRMGMRLASGVTVSSVRLADDWSEAGNVLYIPDYVNTDQYLTVKQQHTEEIWLGLNAEAMNSACLEQTGLKLALEAVCAKRKNVRIMLVGFSAQQARELNIAVEQKMLYPAALVEEWPQLLAQIDLGLAPADREYGARMSWLRAIEFMLMKIPWVGSDLPLHRDLARFGWMVQNSPGAWERVLLEVIDHLDAYRTEAAGEAFFYALGQDVNENIGKVLAAYSSILYKS